MNPLRYLHEKEYDICKNAIENSFSQDGAREVFQCLLTTVTDLIPCRNSEKRTEEILLALEKQSDNKVRFVHLWLTKAIRDDDTFIYAYNKLAQIINRQMYMTSFPIKVISAKELSTALEEERHKEKFDFESVKKQLEAYSGRNDKIRFLIEVKTEYLQNLTVMNNNIGTTFDKQCELEIDKLNFLRDLDREAQKPKQPFFKYLLHNKPEQLANELRLNFSTVKGKGIRFMLEVLEKNDPPLLTIVDRQKKEIYEALTLFFDRNIGSYNSIFQCEINKTFESGFSSASRKLDFILKSIE